MIIYIFVWIDQTEETMCPRQLGRLPRCQRCQRACPWQLAEYS